MCPEETDDPESPHARDEPADAAIYEPADAACALQQGEFVSNVVQVCLDLDELRLRPDTPVVRWIPHPLVVVVSQSCDLEWDHHARPRGEHDKLMMSILFCPVFPATDVKGRKNARGEVINSSRIWTSIRDNKNERYHFFEAIAAEHDASGEGLVEGIADFKQYFSVPTEEVAFRMTSEARRRSRLATPYLEHFATRFFQFQSRIATPRQHRSL